MQDILDFLSRTWTELLARPSGPFAFRFLLQPMMAAMLAVRDGLADARTGRSPYFLRVVRDTGHRRERLLEGIRATATAGALGIAMDAGYQVLVLRAFYPDEALVVALCLCFVPYLLIRGPVARIARRWIVHTPAPPEASDPRHLRR